MSGNEGGVLKENEVIGNNGNYAYREDEKRKEGYY